MRRLEAQRKGQALVDSVMALATAEEDPDNPSRGLFAERAAKDLVTAVKTRSAYRTEVPAKAALSHTVVPTSGQGVEPGLYPSAVPLSPSFRSEAPGPSIRYYRLGDATADVVPEFGVKPDAGVTITPVDVLTKVATTVKFSDESAEDAAFLLTYLERELASAVIHEGERRDPQHLRQHIRAADRHRTRHPGDRHGGRRHRPARRP